MSVKKQKIKGLLNNRNTINEEQDNQSKKQMFEEPVINITVKEEIQETVVKDKVNNIPVKEGNQKPMKPQAVNTVVKQEPINNISVKEEIQETVNEKTEHQSAKKKATFEMDAELHTDLKIFAARQGKKMVDVVEEALKGYMNLPENKKYN